MIRQSSVQRLLNFAVKGFAAQDGVVLHQFQALRRIFAVLLSNVAGSTGHTGVFVLGALQNDLVTVFLALLCHRDESLSFKV